MSAHGMRLEDVCAEADEFMITWNCRNSSHLSTYENLLTIRDKIAQLPSAHCRPTQNMGFASSPCLSSGKH